MATKRIHEVSEVLHEDVFYPAHAPRTESEEYRAVHHRLVVEEDSPCFICGIRNSQLDDPAINTEGVKEIETHHCVVEWSLANAVDAQKVAEYLGVTIDDINSWVDHDSENLMVLCDRHHRHREVGIHDTTYPIWLAQKFLKPHYELTPDPDSSKG